MNIFTIIFVVALCILAVYQVVKLVLEIRNRVRDKRLRKNCSSSEVASSAVDDSTSVDDKNI